MSSSTQIKEVRAKETFPNNSMAEHSNEIDLLALIKAVFSTWKVWLAAAIVLTCLYITYTITTYLTLSDSLPYSKVISFTFPGVERSEYPSGADFSIQDILAPVILQQAYEEMEFSESGFSLVEMTRRLAVEPYSPYYREIEFKYQQLLASKNLDFDQVSAIQDAKRRELQQSVNSGAVLSFDPSGGGLEEQQITALLSLIPRLWAHHGIDNRGVLKAGVQLNSVNTLDEQLFQDVDYIVLSDLFTDKTKALRQNIEKVNSVEGADTVRDPETGWSLRDLESNLTDLETYTIDELMSPIRSLGISRAPRLAAYYYQEKYEVLKDNLATLEEEALLIKAALNSYIESEPLSNPVGGRPDQLSDYPGFVPQLNGDVFDKLLQVAGEDSTEKYRQQLNDRWLEANLAVADAKSKMRRVERLIDAVKGDAQNDLAEEVRDEYLKRAEDGVGQILAQLKDYYAICERIYNQVSRERVGGVGSLYKDAHQGVMRAGSAINLKKAILMYVALMALMTFVLVPSVMIYNALRSRSREEVADA
ncbi:hypothetical protein NBRC116494_25190 [Aurantivibrio plasticivorans]